jgi:hypothetical protein
MAEGASEYELTVAGRLGPKLVTALGGFEVVDHCCGVTKLRGALPDQVALLGAIGRAVDLGIELISLERLANAEP